jgi:cell wall-associated NlpC family hydrolase
VPTAEVHVQQNDWVQAAANWKGVPYRLGGTTREGIDCSGLVQQLYREVRHLEVPRTATEQFQKSVTTGGGAAQPGDLVFFTTTRTFGDETSHVGVVIGNRVFVHASTTLGVTYGSLDDPYWNKRFTGSRRFE